MLKQDMGYGNERGKISVNKNILLSVINLSACEMDGVASMANKFLKFKMSPNCSQFNGVKINYRGNNIDITVFLKLFGDVRVSDVAYKVQENVKNSVTNFVDISIRSINIHVCDAEVR